MLPCRVLESIALRYDTLMSRAMLRALGVTVRRERRARSPRAVAQGESLRYEGMVKCFRNERSPMDRMR